MVNVFYCHDYLGVSARGNSGTRKAASGGVWFMAFLSISGLGMAYIRFCFFYIFYLAGLGKYGFSHLFCITSCLDPFLRSPFFGLLSTMGKGLLFPRGENE